MFNEIIAVEFRKYLLDVTAEFIFCCPFVTQFRILPHSKKEVCQYGKRNCEVVQ